MTLCIVIITICFGSCGNSTQNSSTYDSAGLRYVVNRLKTPSTAKLNAYIDKNGMREICRQSNLPIYSGLELELFEVDGQNAFGAIIRSTFVVFYWRGEPIHMEEGESCLSSPINFSYAITAAEINNNIKIRD